MFHVAYTPDRDVERTTDGNNVSLVCWDCVENHFLASSRVVTNHTTLLEAKEELEMQVARGRKHEPRADCPHCRN